MTKFKWIFWTKYLQQKQNEKEKPDDDEEVEEEEEEQGRKHPAHQHNDDFNEGEDSSVEMNNNVNHGYQRKQQLAPAKYVPVSIKRWNANPGPYMYIICQ